jgi:CheY-like chemotaxis protein
MTLRCLIVDDSPAFLAAARGLLERQGLTVVAVASSGSQAVGLAEALRPDVVLLDIGLDGESGFDVARLLENAPSTARTPVILISTLLEEDYGELISTSPAVGFLPKISLSAEAITEVLQRPGTANGHARTAP